MKRYEDLYSSERRKKECDKIREYWSDKIPIIAQRQEYSNLNDIPKSKIMCPNLLTVRQFISILRKKLSMKENESLFLFIEGKVPNNDELISDIYKKDKRRDGFLYVNYAEQETFGF